MWVFSILYIQQSVLEKKNNCLCGLSSCFLQLTKHFSSDMKETKINFGGEKSLGGWNCLKDVLYTTKMAAI